MMEYLLGERKHLEFNDKIEEEIGEIEFTITKLERQIDFHQRRQTKFFEELKSLRKIKKEYEEKLKGVKQ